MKTLLGCLLALSSLYFMPDAEAATYPGQACISQQAGAPLTYGYGAKNKNSHPVSISCPITRVRDNGTSLVNAVIYFVNDGQSKICNLQNFDIDTGGSGHGVHAIGVRRLVFPVLAPTKYQPLAIYCSLPAGSQVTGYAVGE